MNVWDALFSTKPTEPPRFDLLWYGSLFTLLALTVFLAYRYSDKKSLSTIFPDFTGDPVNPSLRLVFGQPDASDRKSALLSLPFSNVCSAFDPGCL